MGVQSGYIGEIIVKNERVKYTAEDISLSNISYLDSITKLSLLTTLSAYKEAERMLVGERFEKLIDVSALEAFLSYVVNHPVFAPKRFNFDIAFGKNKKIENNRIKDKLDPESSSVLAFSGGIDSTAGLLYTLDHQINAMPFSLYMGQKNEKYEVIIIKNLLNKLKKRGYSVSFDISSQIENGKTTWNYIIPARNFIYLSFAAKLISSTEGLNKKIYLFAHKDEMNKVRNTDKSQYFLDQSAILFSQYYHGSYECVTPFKDVDKTQILSYWRRKWLRKYGISPHDTTTCHEARACGVCDGCLKRTISLLAAGFKEDLYLKNHPFSDKGSILKNSWLPLIQKNSLSPVRLYDLLIALDSTDSAILAPHVSDLLRMKEPLMGKLKFRMKEIDETKL